MSCPVNSDSPVGSTSASECACNAGYELKVDRCEACPEGKFKEDLGNDSCEACAAGTYSNTAGATKADSCADCPLHEYSSDDKSECLQCPVNSGTASSKSATVDSCACNAGYGIDGTKCVACVQGKYKAGAGNEACSSCPSYSTTKLTASKKELDCECDKGSSRENNKCVTCSAGKYKVAIGEAPCSDCIKGKVSTLWMLLHTCIESFLCLSGLV